MKITKFVLTEGVNVLDVGEHSEPMFVGISLEKEKVIHELNSNVSDVADESNLTEEQRKIRANMRMLTKSMIQLMNPAVKGFEETVIKERPALWFKSDNGNEKTDKRKFVVKTDEGEKGNDGLTDSDILRYIGSVQKNDLERTVLHVFEIVANQ